MTMISQMSKVTFHKMWLEGGAGGGYKQIMGHVKKNTFNSYLYIYSANREAAANVKRKPLSTLLLMKAFSLHWCLQI